jgi:hypothetical protein
MKLNVITIIAKQLLHQDKYVKIFYSSDQSLIEHHWTPASYEMTEEEFKKEQLIYLKFVKKLTPLKGFINSKDFMFTITPSTQDWLNSIIHPIYENMGFQKAAFLISNDFFAYVSIRQVFEEFRPFEIQYFEKEDAARQWLAN